MKQLKKSRISKSYFHIVNCLFSSEYSDFYQIDIDISVKVFLNLNVVIQFRSPKIYTQFINNILTV